MNKLAYLALSIISAGSVAQSVRLADPTILELFKGPLRVLLYGGLWIFYAVPLIFACWFVGVLGKASWRAAQRGVPANEKQLRGQSWAFTGIAVAHVAAVAMQILGLGMGWVAPLAAALVGVFVYAALAGKSLSWARRTLAVLPLVAYLIADVAFLALAPATGMSAA